jgi:acetyltransferase-like isoleucine patch superfamily enzyme
MTITLGRHSYCGKVQELFYPDVKVGNFCSIADDVTFMGLCQHPPVHNPLCVSSFPFHEIWGADYSPSSNANMHRPINIGHDVWIGHGAMIMDNVRIYSGAIIGANAVVREDVPAYAVVIGNPANDIHYRFSQDIIDQLIEIAWWDWDDDKIRRLIPSMKNVHTFIQEAGK